ncbi:hypothetical protein ACFPTY_10185 [Halomonas beimenensis]|uniref:hypothetical protein n=1 Tax=Halomonas beimenensis TaxID=475662 RepID=UPI00361595F8
MSKSVRNRVLKEYVGDDVAGVNKIQCGVVYHVVEGRNAWHSTWVSQYSKKSMHTSLKSAKEYAERCRKSGSVFRIKELPCLVFRTCKKTVIITAINSSKPLSEHYLACECLEDFGEIVSDYRKRLSCSRDMVKGFFPNSFGWKRSVKKKDHVIILEHENNEIRVEPLKSESKLFVSKSVGSDNFLEWKMRGGKFVRSFSSPNM